MMILVKIQFHCESDFFKKVCLENRFFFFEVNPRLCTVCVTVILWIDYFDVQ